MNQDDGVLSNTTTFNGTLVVLILLFERPHITNTTDSSKVYIVKCGVLRNKQYFVINGDEPKIINTNKRKKARLITKQKGAHLDKVRNSYFPPKEPYIVVWSSNILYVFPTFDPKKLINPKKNLDQKIINQKQ